MFGRNRVLPLISLLLVIGFLITSLASFFVSRASVRTQIAQNELPLTSDTIYSEIQRDLLQPIFIASLMASDTFLRDWVLDGEQSPDQIIKYLNEIKTQYGAFTSFFVSDKTRVYYHADGVLKTVSPEDSRDRWYFRVREMEEAYEINADPDMANNDTMTIFINYKVFDYEGQLLGATGVGLPLSAVKRLIEDYQEKYQRVVYFAAPDGEIVLHGATFGRDGQTLGQMAGVGPLAKGILSQATSREQFERQGKTVHLNSRFIPEFGWYLLVEQEEHQAMQGIRKTLFINLLVCALITAGVLRVTHKTLSGYQQRLEKMAVTDRLTGLPNRQAYDLLLEKYMLEMQRSTDPMAMILFDIDRFKQINDSHGHLAGDAVLKQVAHLIRESTRSADLICRWGGDEFLIVLRKCTLKDAQTRAQAVQAMIERSPFYYQKNPLAVSVSVGVAESLPGDSTDDLLARADSALYRDKKS